MIDIAAAHTAPVTKVEAAQLYGNMRANQTRTSCVVGFAALVAYLIIFKLPLVLENTVDHDTEAPNNPYNQMIQVLMREGEVSHRQMQWRQES